MCPFWYTTTLFRLVKNTPKSAQTLRQNSQNRQKIRVFYAKSTPARKMYTTAGCVVVTNMSYEYYMFHVGPAPLGGLSGPNIQLFQK